MSHSETTCNILQHVQHAQPGGAICFSLTEAILSVADAFCLNSHKGAPHGLTMLYAVLSYAMPCSMRHATTGRFVGHYAMSPLTVNPAPPPVRAIGGCIARCCPKARKLPYMTDRKPWISFASPTVYHIEVTDDDLNWGNGKDGTHAIGNIAVINAACDASCAAVSAVVGKVPLKVVYGERDGVLVQVCFSVCA